MSRGWSVVLAGVGINLALGILYSWSVISKAIPADWGWTEQQKSWPYAICCLVFSLMMVPAGRLQDKISPRLVATLGGILVGVGMILASGWMSTVGSWEVHYTPFATVQAGAETTAAVAGTWKIPPYFLEMLLGFGLLAGTGIGFGYASATPPAVKWFAAAKTGMIAGIVVSGFGLASVYAAPLTNWLVTLNGGVPQAMLILGIAFLIAVVALAQVLRIPPAGFVPFGTKAPAASAVAKKIDFRPSEMLCTNQFYLLWFMYACGAGAGLMIIAKLAAIADKQAGLSLGFVLVASLAIGNGAGRIIAGMVSDKLGRKPTIVGCLLFQAVLMLVLTLAQKDTALATVPILAVVSALMGANYGANLALYPSVTKDYYGLKNFGVNYGLVFTAWGIGGFALSLLAGKLYDKYGSFTVSCYVAAGLLVVAAFVAILLKPPHHMAEQQAS